MSRIGKVGEVSSEVLFSTQRLGFLVDPMHAILSLILALTTAASSLTLSVSVCQTRESSLVSTKDLRSAPTMITIDNRSFSLTTYPWRDFMNGGANGSPLMVVLKILSGDKQPLPSGIRMDRAWVLFNEELWDVSYLRTRLPGRDFDRDGWINCPNSPVCEATIRGGPKWGPFVYVDVVVRLTDGEGKQYLLQAPQQYVLRSD